MIVILGVVVLVAAVAVGVAGVLANAGDAHVLTDDFAVFGYHVTGSTGTLFLYGIVIGAAGLFGLSVLLAGARRIAGGGRLARRQLADSRDREAFRSADRDDLVEQRQRGTAGADEVRGHRPLGPARRGGLPRFGRRQPDRVSYGAGHP